jgi:thiamine-phosphate pyrophosphorylase
MADKRARAQLARAAQAFRAQSGSALPASILMTDDDRLADPVTAARVLPQGSMIILRARDATWRAELAQALRSIVRARKLKLLIADDPELALAIGADGIHLPEAHARNAACWRARRPNWIITVAAHSLRALSHSHDADAALLSPIFSTKSHPGAASLGTIKLRLAAQQSRRPVYALGGIDAVSVRKLQGAKLAGIAAIGALIPESPHS